MAIFGKVFDNMGVHSCFVGYPISSDRECARVVLGVPPRGAAQQLPLETPFLGATP